MTLTRTLSASAIAGGIALAGLFSAGLGTASAQPGQPCGQPNTHACQPGPQNPAPQNPATQNNGAPPRDINQARQDHQPFDYNGQHVQPLRAGNGDGWGFWFLGQWIRL